MLGVMVALILWLLYLLTGLVLLKVLLILWLIFLLIAWLAPLFER